MSAAAANTDDRTILAALALALVDQPRATLQELASAIGISKATLYRFCQTREQLIDRLSQHTTQAIGDAIHETVLKDDPPNEVLSRLIARFLEHRELTAFLTYYCKETAGSCPVAVWSVDLDSFFLRGQKQGAFCIDIAAATLTEIFISILVGLVDAERRGRVARSGLPALIETVFLRSAAAV